MVRLAGDPEMRRRLADAAYLRLSRDFTVERGIDLMAARFGQAIGQGVGQDVSQDVGNAPAAPAHEPETACACGS
jgi:hypothetical protein